MRLISNLLTTEHRLKDDNDDEDERNRRRMMKKRSDVVIEAEQFEVTASSMFTLAVLNTVSLRCLCSIHGRARSERRRVSERGRESEA